jgi:large subunit ribosomal protein L21
MSYAIISVGGKQYRVSEGEKLLVDRLPQAAGKTFTAQTLLVGGDGDVDLSPKGVTVTARVVEHVLGEKIRIGKYKAKKGYRRHVGYRSRLSRIEIESIGKKTERASKAKAEPAAAEQPKAEPAAAEQPKAAAKPKPDKEPDTSEARAAKRSARRSATTKEKEGQ